MINIKIYLSSHDLSSLSQGDKIKRSILQEGIHKEEAFVIIYNKELDTIVRSEYARIINREFSVISVPLTQLDIEKLSQNKTLIVPITDNVNIHLLTVYPCPICYAPLTERKDLLFECPSCHITLCKHILTSSEQVPKYSFIFECGTCSELSIQKCSCADCQVYCRICKKFLLITCENLQKTLTKQQNEEHKDA